MKSRFIFSIWSDIERFSTHTFDDLHRTWKDEGKRGSGVTGQALVRELNGLVYCYDDHTYELCNSLRLDTVRMPGGDYKSEEGRYCRKLLSMQHALQMYDEVCHMDFDVVLVRPLPEDFWMLLECYAAIQAPLMKHSRKKAKWRADDDAKRYWPNACYMYCRSQSVVTRCVEVARHNPTWYEEGVIGFVIDELQGGWKGHHAYREHGYNPPGMWQLRGVFNSISECTWFVHNNKM